MRIPLASFFGQARRRVKSMTSAMTLLAALFATACATPSLLAQPTQTTGLVGVIGEWSTGMDESPTITVDGTKWNGQTLAADLTRTSLSLFGERSDAFVRNGTSAGSFPLAVATAVRNFTSGTLRVQFNMISGASDQNAGIVFGLQANGEYYYARYNTKDGDLALWRYLNGQRELVVHGTGSSKLALGAWHELVVTLKGRDVTAAITGNDSLALSHRLPIAPSGRVGLWVKRDAVTAFRRFKSAN